MNYNLVAMPKRPDAGGTRARELLSGFLMLASMRGILDDHRTITRGHLAILRNKLTEKIVYLPSDEDWFYLRPVYHKDGALHLSGFREGPMQDTAFKSCQLAAEAYNSQMERADRTERILSIATFTVNDTIIHIEDTHAIRHVEPPGR